MTVRKGTMNKLLFLLLLAVLVFGYGCHGNTKFAVDEYGWEYRLTTSSGIQGYVYGSDFTIADGTLYLERWYKVYLETGSITEVEGQWIIGDYTLYRLKGGEW